MWGDTRLDWLKGAAVAAVLVCLCWVLTACTYRGDTVFSVTFNNDTNSVVEGRLCESESCHVVDESSTFRPGERRQANVRDDGVWQYYQFRVQSTKAVLGCISFHFSTVRTGVVYRLSQTHPCAR